MFCSLFFLHSGERLWGWVLGQLPVRRARWDAAGRAGWTAFAGYTRGVVLVAVSNATLVGIALSLLKVPLALPLSLLVLLGAFIPLIGAPIALWIATLVALAGRGPLTALAVLVLIVVIGQIEGHVLHPLIMSRAVKLHPVVVAVSVASGHRAGRDHRGRGGGADGGRGVGDLRAAARDQPPTTRRRIRGRPTPASPTRPRPAPRRPRRSCPDTRRSRYPPAVAAAARGDGLVP